MAQLCASLGTLAGPRLSLEPYGGKGIAVLLDGGRGGAILTRAAPWLPGMTVRRDLTATTRGVADALHSAVRNEWVGVINIGSGRPRVTSRGNTVALQFFGVAGEPLPVVEVQLPKAGHG